MWAQKCRVETIFHLETCLASFSNFLPTFIHPRLFSATGHLILTNGLSSVPHCVTVRPNERAEIPCCRSSFPLPRPLSKLAAALISCCSANPVQVRWKNCYQLLRQNFLPQENKMIITAARDRLARQNNKGKGEEVERNAKKIEQLSNTVQLLVDKINKMEKRSEP